MRYSKFAIKLIDVQFCCLNSGFMLFSEYLHEKAEESRHNETIGYLIIIIGSVFLSAV
ncbi:MAG: hypothetical protein QXM65_04970 [Candidatus Bathyarchaeia archaeon]